MAFELEEYKQFYSFLRDQFKDRNANWEELQFEGYETFPLVMDSKPVSGGLKLLFSMQPKDNKSSTKILKLFVPSNARTNVEIESSTTGLISYIFRKDGSPDEMKNRMDEINKRLEANPVELLNYNTIQWSKDNKDFTILYAICHKADTDLQRFAHGQYFNYETIEDRLQQINLDESTKRQVALKLIDCVIKIHEKEIIHNDIKPPNIYLKQHKK